MPEFPEVNIQVRYLKERCEGFEIASFGHSGWKHFQNLPEEGRGKALEDFFTGNTIESVTQRGKQVIMRTTRGVMASHLMFKGRWSMAGDHFISNYKRHRTAPTASSVTFWVQDPSGRRLNFHTPEYKAHVSFWPGITDPSKVDALSKLGPEVLVLPETDPAFSTPWSVEEFTARASRSKQAIKAFLLDQKRQSGLGNIYVCEALYDARVDPRRSANSLSADERQAVVDASRTIMRRALELDLDYDKLLRVYNLSTTPDGEAVTCEAVGGRDTWFAPARQR